MPQLEPFLSIAVVLLLAATLFHAVRLERRLGVLRRDRAALEALVKGFNDATIRAEAATARLRGAADSLALRLRHHSDAVHARRMPVSKDAVAAYNRVIEHQLASALTADRQDALIGQLQHALEHRVQIERAIGMVMGQDGLDPVAAFNRLRATARAERRRVAEVAGEVLAGRRLA